MRKLINNANIAALADRNVIYRRIFKIDQDSFRG
jgi:hypothetical protein